MEEERRLCYVAMTRAMRRLVFTSARQRTLFGRTAASAPSRFVQEVSAENIDLVNEYPDYSGSYGFDSDFSFVIEDRYVRDFDPYDDTPRDASEAWRKYQPRKTASSRKKAYNELFKELTAAGADYKAGDRIIHSAYGRGMITKLTPAGGDALLEVVFDDVGTKQLLLNSAARFMGKSDE
jgi:DNA helicase-2/ATP-dependent DNA helicase PcrA